jgi:D-sedoheptulose 7-phosphate isomerase
MNFIRQYLDQVQEIAQRVDVEAIERVLDGLVRVREGGGRLFILGVGGSAANASHAVNDFRKICGIEAYSATDNVSELTARINDEGWDGSYAAWLKVSRLNAADAILVLSVGGGNAVKGVSVNLVRAVDHARSVGAQVLGIVGRDGGYTARNATACVVIPTVDATAVTPHTEAFQGTIWHLLVSHPKLAACATKWESVDGANQGADRRMTR